MVAGAAFSARPQPEMSKTVYLETEDRHTLLPERREQRSAGPLSGRAAKVKKHLDRVFFYLSELQADPNGWDFEGKLAEYAMQIAEEITPELRVKLPLDFLGGRRQVEALVDTWLARHCSEVV